MAQLINLSVLTCFYCARKNKLIKYAVVLKVGNIKDVKAFFQVLIYAVKFYYASINEVM